MQRQELNDFFAEMFAYDEYDDYCHNGLQVEGKEDINTVAFGVSVSLPLLERAVALKADAVVVHHGFFGKGFLKLTGMRKRRVQLLFDHGISLFGIHLPLDAHPECGNNIQLLQYLGAEATEPLNVGYIGRNTAGHTVAQMLDIFHERLHPASYTAPGDTVSPADGLLLPEQRHGFSVYRNGPEVPVKIAVMSGEGDWHYRQSELHEQGVDTYITGATGEPVPAVSYETGSNYIDLGHYWSEKAGVLALQQAVEQRFGVTTHFIEVENTV